ncbi:MAG: hydrogen peroxide-inducible genes activator [Prevotellaceae bacterium]|jgi:LysR family hydrogen peroxide-inducible transcriptional activator|nr:hydrogen peroxide-inducible genes activator [Prevotellaceae bacterium]
MTITQLKYVIAVDRYRNFAQAAESCYVTQPTLSMQIQKLEEELDIIIFDRSKKPVICTDVGRLMVEQAQVICKEFIRVPEIIKSCKGEVNGLLNLGIIPTIAPYLVPLFILKFMKNYPEVSVNITEMTTAQIIKGLKDNTIDCGILATPLHEKNITEIPLFYEPLVAYVSPKNHLSKLKTLLPDDIDGSELLLLTEEHCLRSQIAHLCNSKVDKSEENTRLNYITGSLETIKRMVELNDGITLLPELGIANFSLKQLNMVRYFRGIEPVREVSIAVHRNYVKPTLINALKEQVIESVPEKMKNKRKKMVLDI